MMKRLLTSIVCALAVGLIATAAPRPVPAFKPVCDSIRSYFGIRANPDRVLNVSGASVANHKLNIIFSSALAEFPLREGDISTIYQIVDDLMPEQYQDYVGKVIIRTDGQMLEDLVSKYYTKNRDNDDVKEHLRLVSGRHNHMASPLVSNTSLPYEITRGLQKRHIALWQSHGLYYEPSLLRWEWQRGRIFGTVEDLYTQSYVLPFLMPMLENAGANVLLPRERDWNTTEIIVDNDLPDESYREEGTWEDSPYPGFRNADGHYINGQNPFKMGTSRCAKGSKGNPANASSITWAPYFPHSGRYAVYVSYTTLSSSTTSARYEVCHSGGTTVFNVNQKMGGGTWICLGTFDFDEGNEGGQGVFLNTGDSNENRVVTADAVKFGGGMGNIARSPLASDFMVEPEVSGYPRAAEGSRYWLQWAGFNDTIYSPTSYEKDYTDDFQSRGKWVNALAGGSYMIPGSHGYNIPIDLSFAFHTDAGLRPADSIVGTLAIYTSVLEKKDVFPNGEKRGISRDYADIVQTQITDDIRAICDPNWVRRSLRDKTYAECSRPSVPSMILELLSHQNFNDMKLGLDPKFRFVVSRAIYKGMLKYLAYINNTGYTVQPLPVKSFSATLSRVAEEGTCFANLAWEAQEDKLEKSAVPTGYVIYTRKGHEGGFDNGILVESNEYRIQIEPGTVYSFKVCAVNAGGRSFDSEILSVGASSAQNGGHSALIVNNFNRISGPSNYVSADSTAVGFLYDEDFGVPYKSDIAFCGKQYDFRRGEKWHDDDNPGFGASLSDYEAMEIAGNTFDYPALHGHAMLEAGWDFSSCSAASFRDSSVSFACYKALDIICGKENKAFDEVFMKRIVQNADNGCNIIVSGSRIASANATDTIARIVMANTMKCKLMTTHAASSGFVHSSPSPLGMSAGNRYCFNTLPSPDRYHVESADGIVPAGDSCCRTIFRYDGNNISAGTAYIGEQYKAVHLGFPIEALTSQDQIDGLIASILKLF